MLFTLLLPPLTSLKKEVILFKVKLSLLLSPLLYTNSLKLDNKSVTVKTLYCFYMLGTLT